ncbi:MAG: hypothetical protein ACK5L3_13550 [Oscillospiraceae bacterium]
MDTALALRRAADAGQLPPPSEVGALLRQSPLVSRLTASFEPKPTYAVWRLVALAEIPGTGQLPYTQALLRYIEQNMVCEWGFSLDGTAGYFLPCYGAMLLEAYCKLGLAHRAAAQNTLARLKRYQRLERGTPTLWEGKGIQKYGGCLKSTPCFIGVAKSVKAAAHYCHATAHADKEAEAFVERGMAYILQHRLYQRLSSKEPINGHILDIAFPASYQLNIVELLELCLLTGRLGHPACADALAYVNSKRGPGGFWKTTHSYRGPGYVLFDPRGKPAEWAGHILSRCL